MTRDKLLEEVTRLYDVAIAKWRMASEGTLSQAYYDGESNGIDLIKSLILQLDEPEKVVIPQYVADWIELHRERESNIWHLMNNVEIKADRNVELWTWLWGDNNADLIARAWLDGYEVDSRKKMTIIIKDKNREIFKTEMLEDEAVKLFGRLNECLN